MSVFDVNVQVNDIQIMMVNLESFISILEAAAFFYQPMP